MPLTFLAEDLGLRPITAAKITTMEEVITSVGARWMRTTDPKWAAIEAAALAMGFCEPSVGDPTGPLTFELDGLIVMFEVLGTMVQVDVCKHVHTEDEWDHLHDDPLTSEHLSEGYQIIRLEDGTARLLFGEWGEWPCYYGCGEVSA